jgi:tetraacyldisaccharide 4'-kinase
MSILTPFLFPFAVLYDAVTSIRNRLYETGVRPSARFDIPVVGVGNLSVGGTGKTPMIEYLIRLLGDECRVATLSRGYGRKTTGIRIATPQDNAETIGDEPFQFYRKFKDKVVVAVGEERAFAIPYVLDEHPDINVVLLDDAFQHRKVKPGFQILLTDYHNLFVNDLLLPAGRLRESKRGAARADVIIVTKCPPAITDDEMIAIESSIRQYSSKAVFFTRICYGHLLPVTDVAPYKPEKIILVSGIANAAPLEAYVARNYELVKHFSFADHHMYSKDDIDRICEAAATMHAVVVTTEKDMVKMDPEAFRSASLYLHYLPIEMEFLKNGKEFDELVLNAVRTYAK